MEPFISPRPNSATSRRSVRRFSLLDAMILIAATAAGLAFDRVAWSLFAFWAVATRGDRRDLAAKGIVLSVPIAAMWTVATLALQLRPPRDRLRRLLRRPGMAACCAATCGLAIGGGLMICAMRSASAGVTSDLVLGFGLGYGLPTMAGSAVTAVWTLSMLAGGYRAASDWIDRLGRLVGLCWVMSIPVLGWALTR
jgi:hypothetical protein